jgi:hypothetical protein
VYLHVISPLLSPTVTPLGGWSGYSATNRKVSSSIPRRVIRNFILLNPSCRAMPKGVHARTSLASESGWARVPMSQTRPCVECHEPDFVRLYIYIYSKTCLKRNAIVPVFFSVFTGFRFTKGCVLKKQSTKIMIA